MLRKIFYLFFLILIFTGCTQKNDYSINDENINLISGISLSIKENTLSRNGLTLIIEDQTNRGYLYNTQFQIDKKVDGKWKPLKYLKKENVWSTQNLVVDENNKLELFLNWQSIYGELENGEYRLIKFFTDSNRSNIYYLSINFYLNF